MFKVFQKGWIDVVLGYNMGGGGGGSVAIYM